MITDLKHYVLHQKEFFDKELCAQTVSDLQRLKFKPHTYYNAAENTDLPRTDGEELSVTWDHDNEVSTNQTLVKKLWQAISNYLDYIDTTKLGFYGWNGYTALRFNKYMKNKRLPPHCDHIQSMFDGTRKGIPILSIVGTLNDDYEGGEFIMFDDYEIPFKTGDVVMFPSVFLYPHRVEPVTKGIRYSYSSWVW